MVKGLLYGDLLMQLLHRVRPYEQEKGAADALYKLMSQLCKDSLAGLTGLSFEQTIKRVTAAFDVLPLRDNVRKPKVASSAKYWSNIIRLPTITSSAILKLKAPKSYCRI